MNPKKNEIIQSTTKIFIVVNTLPDKKTNLI